MRNNLSISNSRRIKNGIRLICFAVVFLVIVLSVDRVLSIKDPTLDPFYAQEKNTVDVLILGSSHAYESINNGEMYENYGIASYIMGGPAQPLWNSYYYLREAMKYQKPKLIVLEAFGVILTEEYALDSWQISNTFPMRWSPDKVKAMMVSSPREKWPGMFLSYTQYHTRYTDLNFSDFLPYNGENKYRNWKGYSCNSSTEPYTDPYKGESTGETGEIYEKEEEYYRKIIEYAKQMDIPILVIVSPFPGNSEETEMKFNRAEEIAREYGVGFHNFNLNAEEMQLDYRTDAADSQHLNYRGAVKYGDFLGKWLKEHYDLPDRRGDEHYTAWEEDASYIRAEIDNITLGASRDLASYTAALHGSFPHYRVFVSIDGEADSSDPRLQELMDTLFIPKDGKKGVFDCDNARGLIYAATEGDATYYTSFGRTDYALVHYASGYNAIVVEKEMIKKVENGVNIAVYDTVTGWPVDSVGIDTANECALVR